MVCIKIKLLVAVIDVEEHLVSLAGFGRAEKRHRDIRLRTGVKSLRTECPASVIANRDPTSFGECDGRKHDGGTRRLIRDRDRFTVRSRRRTGGSVYRNRAAAGRFGFGHLFVVRYRG